MTNIDPGWCDRVLERLAREGFSRPDPSYPSWYRSNDRWVADDPGLAGELFARIAPALPGEQRDEAGVWRLSRLNPRMRACRYREGQAFGPHRDGVCWASERERSFLSVVVYLDDGFEGGDTELYDEHRALVGRVVPARGRVAIFEHSRWHAGAPVTRGTKHVLRTDVLYAREHGEAPGHLGYVWSLARVGPYLASGGRDRTIQLWSGEARASRTLAHEASVTCLAALADDRLASGSRDGRVLEWRVDAGGALRLERERWRHDGAVLALCARGGRLASAGADGVVVSEGARERRHQGWAWGLAWTEDGRLASVGEDGRLSLGDRALCLGVPLLSIARCDLGLVLGARDGRALVLGLDGAIARELSAHEGPVTALLAHEGGFASCAEDGAVRAWSRGGALSWQRRHEDFVRALCVAPDGALVSAGYDGIRR